MFIHRHRGRSYSAQPISVFPIFVSVLAIVIPALWAMFTLEIWIQDGGSLSELLRAQWHYIRTFFHTHSF